MSEVKLKRFDDTYDCIVEFVLTDKRDLHFSMGGPTEEGYDYTHESYSLLNDEWVELQIARDARDCDGGLRTTTLLYWNAKNGDVSKRGTPMWISEHEYQFAESEREHRDEVDAL